MDDVAAALDTGSPLPLLALASSMLAALTDRPRFGRPAVPEAPPLDEVMESLFAVDVPETSALLAAVSNLSGDALLRHRVRREIGARGHVLPRWLLRLDQAEPVDRAVVLRHVLGDGESIVLAVRLPEGHDVCAAVHIDHNLGTLVKDALVVPGRLSGLVDLLVPTADDPDTTLTELDPADARARITEAMELSAITFPPIETDTWPGCRPFVEWSVGLLPTGGTGYVRPEWTDGDRQALAERFFTSPFGAGLDDADRRSLLESLLWFGCDYGPGDPLRWSPVVVEILLADWIPRKIVADVPYLAQAPELLRAFIRFSHAQRGIRPGLTAETLAAVDELEPEYQTTIRTPRPQGPAALLAAVGALDPGGPWLTEAVGPGAVDESMLDELRATVGGASALDRLDDRPLPDEPFDWQRVPADVADRVAEVLALVDRCCAELFDVEFRTAARRLLASVVAADPHLVGRRRADGTAAAVCWIVGKANRVFDTGPAVKDLAACFGVGSGTASQRAKPLLAAIGVDPTSYAYTDPVLGSPDCLVAARRAALVAARDRYREAHG